jgi:hypothetical protein
MQHEIVAGETWPGAVRPGGRDGPGAGGRYRAPAQVVLEGYRANSLQI